MVLSKVGEEMEGNCSLKTAEIGSKERLFANKLMGNNSKRRGLP